MGQWILLFTQDRQPKAGLWMSSCMVLMATSRLVDFSNNFPRLAVPEQACGCPSPVWSKSPSLADGLFYSPRAGGLALADKVNSLLLSMDKSLDSSNHII